MKPLSILFWLAVSGVLYAPIGYYEFGHSLGEMFERSYFTIGGAALALWLNGAFDRSRLTGR
jgi:hypothetical protein